MSPANHWRTRRVLGLALVFALGSALLALHLVHALGEDEGLASFVFGIAIPMVFAAGLALGGAWLWRAEEIGEGALRVAVWSLVGGAVLGGGAALTVLYQWSHGVAMDDPLYVGVDAVSFGAVVGFVVGVYDVRQRAARARAVRAREESERLNRRLTVLHRVLRHDIRNAATVIRGQAELIDAEGTDSTDRIIDRADDLVSIGDQVRSIERMARTDDATRNRFAVVDLVSNPLSRVDREYPDVTVSLSVPDDEGVLAYPALQSAVGVLFEEVFDDGTLGSVDVTCTRRRQDDVERVEVGFAFDGVTLPAEAVTAVERGYETDLEHAQGLGLWLVTWATEESGGSVHIETDCDGRTTVSLLLDPTDGHSTTASDGPRASDSREPVNAGG